MLLLRAASCGNQSVMVAPLPGALRMARVPPKSAARSRIPANPNDKGFFPAVPALKPAPLSRTLSLILLSVSLKGKVYLSRLRMFRGIL